MRMLTDRRLLFLFLFLLQIGFSSPVFASVFFNANWDYYQFGGEDRETLRLFQQRYTYGLGLGNRLSYQPTSALTASAGVAYTRSQSNTINGIYDIEQLTPSIDLGVTNDIFQGQFSTLIRSSKVTAPSGAISENSRRAWDASLATAWDIPLVPVMRLGIGQSTNSNAGIFSAIDQSSSNTGNNKNFTLDWNLILAKFNYTYTDTTSTDPYENLSEAKSHFARFETGTSLWQKRLGLYFSQQYQKSTQDFTLSASEDGSSYLPLGGLSQALVIDPAAGIDPFALPEPLDVTLTGNAKLSDGNFDEVALTVGLDQRVALGFKFDFEKQIDILRLTILTPLTPVMAEALQWSLYVRDLTGTGWVQASDEIMFTYDSIDKRFTLTIDRPEAEIMVVAINNTGAALDFSEIAAFSQQNADFSSTYTDSITSVGMGLKLTPTLKLSVNLGRDHAENASGANITNTSERRSTSANLRWDPIPSVSPTLGFSDTRTQESGQPASRTLSYRLTLASIPLPSMNVIFGASHNENYVGELKAGTSNRYNLNVMARIYPDLSTSMSLGANETRQFSDSTGIIGKATTLSGSFSLIAKLRRYVTANLSSNYIKSRRSTEINSETANASLRLQYRPSTLLAVHGNYDTTLLGASSADRYSFGLDLALFRGAKARLSLSATHTQAENSRDNIFLNGGWDISKNLSLISTYNFVIADKYSYAFHAAMRLGF